MSSSRQPSAILSSRYSGIDELHERKGLDSRPARTLSHRAHLNKSIGYDRRDRSFFFLFFSFFRTIFIFFIRIPRIMFIFMDGRNQKENVPLRLLFILNGNLRAGCRVALARSTWPVELFRQPNTSWPAGHIQSCPIYQEKRKKRVRSLCVLAAELDPNQCRACMSVRGRA